MRWGGPAGLLVRSDTVILGGKESCIPETRRLRCFSQRLDTQGLEAVTHPKLANRELGILHERLIAWEFCL